ncbi:MAG: hypothetical protein M1816_003745 [Peltula sp. TS41687]|nr:MAG: hypothetical protein M1816_003745 [Peltula sp. TS41687]
MGGARVLSSHHDSIQYQFIPNLAFQAPSRRKMRPLPGLMLAICLVGILGIASGTSQARLLEKSTASNRIENRQIPPPDIGSLCIFQNEYFDDYPDLTQESKNFTCLRETSMSTKRDNASLALSAVFPWDDQNVMARVSWIVKEEDPGGNVTLAEDRFS